MGIGAIVWLLWRPVIGALVDGYEISSIVKNYYMGDQFAYMAIASNVEHGYSAYVEPYTRTGSSIFPGGYAWLLGIGARIFGGVFAAWNILGVAATSSVAILALLWARWAVPSGEPGSWGWLLFPIPFFAGTFQWMTGDGWIRPYGEQAVLWQPAGILFSPGSEVPALVLSLACILALVRMLEASGHPRVLLAAIAGLAGGLTVDFQTYVAMFTALVAAGILFFDEAFGYRSARWRFGWLAVFLTLGLAMVWTPSSPSVLRLLVVLAVVSASVVLSKDWRRRLGLPAAVLTMSALVAASPLLIRITAQALDDQSFFYIRQAAGAGRDLSLPPLPVLLQFLPTWVLAGVGIAVLGRSGRGTRDRCWIAALTAIGVATAAMAFNQVWGLNQEPYRFLPYGVLLLGVCSVPILGRLVTTGGGSGRLTAGVLLLGFVLTIPTTIAFSNGTRALLPFPASERRAYEAVSATLPPRGLTLLDRCFGAPPGLFKAATGASVVGLNAGLALPADPEALSAAAAFGGDGMPATTGTLLRAGVSRFVTHNYCRSDFARIRERFGEPVASVAPPSTIEGAPADLTYLVFKVPGFS
ncbi:MAG: hypothetical protein HYX33_04095 [Actinobacteria bacterium]|nr:hypothetical protein [Actinomycetota bacterium]